MRGGGIGGPSGEVARERAGEPGEYHHSKNFTKKIVVGSNKRKESRSSRGDAKRDFRSLVVTLRRCIGEVCL